MYVSKNRTIFKLNSQTELSVLIISETFDVNYKPRVTFYRCRNYLSITFTQLHVTYILINYCVIRLFNIIYHVIQINVTAFVKTI